MTRTPTTIAPDGVEIAYSVHGAVDAPLSVVLVHGWAGNRSYWVHQVGPLSERHQVITVDLGGHGESGLGRTDWNLQAFGDDVVAVVEVVGAQQVVLVGHSMGGDAVVYAARALGDRVAGVVWVDVLRSLGDEPVSPPETVDGFVAPFREDFAAAVDQFARSLFPATADSALVDRVAADMVAARRDATLGSIGYALNREPPLLTALKELTAPCVAINPDIGPTDVESMRRFGVEPVVIDGVGHFVMLEAPVRFNEVLATTIATFGY